MGVACRRDVQLLQFGTAKNSPLMDGGDNCREGGGRRRSDNGGVVETHGGGGVVSTYLSSTCGRRRTVTCRPRRRQLRLRTGPAPPDRQPTDATVRTIGGSRTFLVGGVA